ncbi:hypothetical protein C9374_004677 [Naegleria lovaniensis]|uniref:Uncharacterized protein n=1 Tax=Naegleria lovaniensis TaxID=51637 RepID=A0AA88GSL2_NAELO|nr:uncharacterized protein C9374_004677 [Naegleria lovaniensis]KAG2383340.1 hypothetical protein C9374_004677 [Naegleria lovaniensis]
MEQIIQQIQCLEQATREDEEKIEKERFNHQETQRLRDKTLREMDEVEKRNQALSESILQFEVNNDGIKLENQNLKALLKESKSRLWELQTQLDERKKEVDSYSSQVAQRLHQINASLAEKVKNNSINNVMKQTEVLKRRLTELKRRDDLRRKLEPSFEANKLDEAATRLESERGEIQRVLAEQQQIVETRRMELDKLLNEFNAHSERFRKLSQKDSNDLFQQASDISSITAEDLDVQVPDSIREALFQSKSELLSIREKHAEEDAMATTLEQKLEEMGKKTQELNEILNSMSCSKCSVNMALTNE